MKLHLEPRTKTWGIRFSRKEKPPRGKRVSLRKFAEHPVYDEKEAKEWFEIIERRWLAGKLRELDQGRRITLEGLAKAFVAAREKDLSSDTIRMDKLALRLLGDVVGSSKSVRTITAKDLRDFKNTCLARDLSPESVRSYLRHIKAALNFAIEDGYLASLPKIPTVAVPKRLPRVIPKDDLQKIIDWALKNNPRLWRYICFALKTGCRESECISVRAEEIMIYQCPRGPVVGWARVIGKGNKEREVPLLTHALEALDPLGDIGPVFAQVHPDTLSGWFHEAVVACGLQKEKYCFHGLRHTAASEMLDRGVNIVYVQKILGHVDIRTTMVYFETNKRSIEKDLAKMA